MTKKVEILKETVVYERYFFRMLEARLRHERYDGTLSDEITRLRLDRGDSVAAVIHQSRAKAVWLTEQFRYPAYPNGGPGWLLELPAGVVDANEEPEAAMRRELSEETGFNVEKLEPITTLYLSPGGSSERVHLFYAAVIARQRTEAGGGLLHEGEDIRVVRMDVADIPARIAAGDIMDAKTLAGLQWLLLNR